ncbi:MAG: trypsin-like serine protease [Myxococcales bacterium]|nr:trypsin-like serine protease [Myxococcales bacterium]
MNKLLRLPTLSMAMLVAQAACVPSAPNDVPDTVEDSAGKAGIVGGGNASITDYPWQISLQTSSGSHFCGGSIIDANWILTANHCVQGETASQLRIVAGITRRSQSSSGQIRSVSQIIQYPGYSSPESGKDAALLRLSSPLDLSTTSARAIAIATPADASAGLTNAGVNATVTGWGTLSSGSSSLPDTLQAVVVPIVSNASASSAYGQTITADQLAAGIIGVGGKDSCQGDSGGPLVVPDGVGGVKLAGIVSWGIGCGDARYPGLYGRVSSFASWIQGYVSPNSAPTVNLTSPSNGATLSGTVNASATASDSDGTIARVTFTFPDGTTINDTTSPYSASWNSTGYPDGAATIRAQAFDNLGAASGVSQANVTLQNGNSSCATGAVSASDTPISIPDNNTTGVESNLTISGAGTITNLTVSVNISHTYRGDLAVQLVSPGGTTHILSNRAGGSADNLIISNLDVNTFDGESASGVWRLRVQDLARADTGTINSFSVNITATCDGGGNPPPTPTGWSASATPNVATVDNGSVCNSVTVSGSGNASEVQLDLAGVHDWRSVLRGTLAHNGTTVEAFPTGTFARQGGSFGFTNRAIAGFSGSATGTWTLCIYDTDAYGDTGTLQSWGVHN